MRSGSNLGSHRDERHVSNNRLQEMEVLEGSNQKVIKAERSESNSSVLIKKSLHSISIARSNLLESRK